MCLGGSQRHEFEHYVPSLAHSSLVLLPFSVSRLARTKHFCFSNPFCYVGSALKPINDGLNPLRHELN